MSEAIDELMVGVNEEVDDIQDITAAQLVGHLSRHFDHETREIERQKLLSVQLYEDCDD
jgi:hypothetical protein